MCQKGKVAIHPHMPPCVPLQGLFSDHFDEIERYRNEEVAANTAAWRQNLFAVEENHPTIS